MHKQILVILDTNCFWHDKDPSSTTWKEFRQVHSLFDSIVFVPAVVSHELVGLRVQAYKEEVQHFRSRLRSAEDFLRSVNTTLEALELDQTKHMDSSAIARAFMPSSVLNADDYPAFTAAAERRIAEHVGKYELGRLPEISHADVLKRCGMRSAPFTHDKGKDTGYKDYLFWLDAVQCISRLKRQTFIISKDGIFGDGNTGKLNPGFAEDFVGLPIDIADVIVCDSVESFVKKVITPNSVRDLSYLRMLTNAYLEPIGSQLVEFSEQIATDLAPRVAQFTIANAELSIKRLPCVLAKITDALQSESSGKLLTGTIVASFYVRVREVSAEPLLIETVITHWISLEVPIDLYVDRDVVKS